jgi:hypothetical protein
MVLGKGHDMGRTLTRLVLPGLILAVATLGLGGAALAVSGGGYDPVQQDCPANADSTDKPGATAGCSSYKLNVADSHQHRFVEVGIAQTPRRTTPELFPGVPDPRGDNVAHAVTFRANTNANGSGTGISGVLDAHHPEASAYQLAMGAPNGDLAQLLNGLFVYNGADDNLDFGEHDGVDGAHGTAGSVNGPSDGGAIVFRLSPGAATTAPSAIDPLPIAGLSMGACADGFCAELTTVRQLLYQGNPNTTDSRDVANYQGKQFDPYGCSSGDTQAEIACRGKAGQPQTMDAWRNAEAHRVNAQPGLQVYEDPDPQGSPLDPLFENGTTKTPTDYPLPAVYAGTCGVILGGGAVSAPKSPATNGAGQLVIAPTGC